VKPSIIQQKDFTTANDIDVKIISKSEADEERTNKLTKIMPLANFALSRQGSKFAKDKLLRDIYKMAGFDTESVNTYIDLTPEECQAYEDLELINRNEAPKQSTNPNEDHWTYYVIYQSAIDTPAKRKALEQRMQLYILS